MIDSLHPVVSEYYDNGVRFGTGTEMIAEIKRLRLEMVEKAREMMDSVARDREAAEQNLSRLRKEWRDARDEWLRLVALQKGISDAAE